MCKQRRSELHSSLQVQCMQFTITVENYVLKVILTMCENYIQSSLAKLVKQSNLSFSNCPQVITWLCSSQACNQVLKMIEIVVKSDIKNWAYMSQVIKSSVISVIKYQVINKTRLNYTFKMQKLTCKRILVLCHCIDIWHFL